MKRLKVSRQLLIIFSVVLFMCTLAFSVMMVLRMKDYATSVTYDRLKSYSEIFGPNQTEDTNELSTAGFEVAWIRGNLTSSTTASIDTSDNISTFLTDCALAVNQIQIGKGVKGTIDNESGKTLYYYAETDLRGVFQIYLTDGSYIKASVIAVIYQSIMIFSTVFILGIIIIAIWNHLFVKRISRLQKHINDLSKNNYEVSYTDNGSDEIADIAESVEQMRLQIKENETIKQEMLQNVSHDFKTPIAVIKSYSEAIADGVADTEACNIIIAQADKLKRKVNILLQYNRLAYLQKDKEFEHILMSELIREIVDNYKFRSTVQFELDLEDVYFDGYHENLYTIVDNILDNAQRYVKSLIKITLKDDTLTIYNDGEHIDEKFLNGLFKPYEKGSKGQFGLGMSIVVKTCNFFDLDFNVQNEEVGVSFIIKKPN